MSLAALGTGVLNYFDGTGWVPVGGAATPWYSTFGEVGLLDLSSYTAVASDATVNTKGAWVELIASTSADANAISLHIANYIINFQNPATLIDIGTGAAGSETVLVGDIGVGGAGQFFTLPGGLSFTIPIRIPAGTRIALRSQSAYTGLTGNAIVAVHAWGDTTLAPTSVDVLGTDTSTSQAFVPTINGGWTEIVASTAQDYDGFVFVISGNGAHATNSRDLFASLGVGAAGSETSIIRQRFLMQGSGEQVSMFTFFTRTIWHPVPAGSRLVVQTEGSTNSTPGCTVIGIPKL